MNPGNSNPPKAIEAVISPARIYYMQSSVSARAYIVKNMFSVHKLIFGSFSLVLSNMGFFLQTFHERMSVNIFNDLAKLPPPLIGESNIRARMDAAITEKFMWADH